LCAAAGQVVIADSRSVSFALMELGGSVDERGNADLMDAASTLAWPIAGYTYYITRKGLSSTGANFMASGDQLVMFDCDTRRETFKYMEWFYTSTTPVAIGDQLGFTTLPSFIAESILQDMLGENYCQDSVSATPTLAKEPTAVNFQWIYVSDVSSYLLDTYVNVYKEIDPLVQWSYKVMPSGELDATLLKPGAYTDSEITSAALEAGLGIAHIRASEASTVPDDIVATPLFSVGVALIYHLKLDEAAALAASMDTIGDLFLRNVDSFLALDSSLAQNANVNTSDTTFKFVVRSDACDTTEIATAGLVRYFQCAEIAAGSVPGLAPPICTCLGTTGVRQLDASYFDGSRPGCGSWDMDDIVFVDSEPAAEAAVTYYPSAIGFWAKVGTLEGTRMLAISGIAGLGGADLTLSISSLEACVGDETAFTLGEDGEFAYTLFDLSLSTAAGCWPFAREYALVIKQVHITSAQCSPTDFYAGDGESLSAEFAQWLYSTNDVVSAISNLGLVPASESVRTEATDLLTFTCNPDFSACEAGAYINPSQSGPACLECPSGSVSGSAGQTQCQECSPGTYERSRTVCLPCASDQYQPEAGQTSCRSCVANSLYIVKSDDETIPFIPQQGATSKDQCACTEGYYAPRGSDQGEECLECPEGAVCEGTGFETRIVPVPETGFYFRDDEPEVMLQCLTSFACPGGALNECGDGYKGDMYGCCPLCPCLSALTAPRCLAVLVALSLLALAHGGSVSHSPPCPSLSLLPSHPSLQLLCLRRRLVLVVRPLQQVRARQHGGQRRGSHHLCPHSRRPPLHCQRRPLGLAHALDDRRGCRGAVDHPIPADLQPLFGRPRELAAGDSRADAMVRVDQHRPVDPVPRVHARHCVHGPLAAQGALPVHLGGLLRALHDLLVGLLCPGEVQARLRVCAQGVPPLRLQVHQRLVPHCECVVYLDDQNAARGLHVHRPARRLAHDAALPCDLVRV
jgi:hypothetical protein